ncbi:MAG TPA: protein-disulfide reductase DsbD domain-containing protein [Tepidisphaeraceae bacterium]|nr:protein-disulfide reductase DsbD domain-containing protein [Tepidisphaeraceae bacterium]
MRTSLLVILTVALSTFAFAQKAPLKESVKTSIFADITAIQPGKPFKIGVLLKIEPHWHIYWTNSGDAGIPTKVELKLPEGFTASAIEYPTPSRIEQSGGIVMYGYSGEVMLLATITPPAQIASSKIKITTPTSWLVCDENSCLPGQALGLNLELPIAESAKPANSELFNHWNKQLPCGISSSEIADHKEEIAYQTKANHTTGVWTSTIQWKGDAPAQVEWFPPASEAVLFNNKFTVQTTGRTTVITAGFDLPPTPANAAPAPDSVLSYRTPAGRVGVTLPIVLSGNPNSKPL